MPYAYGFNPYAVPIAIAGAGMLSIGLLVSFRRRLEWLGISFGMVCVFASLWLFGISGMFLAANFRTALWWDKYVSLLGAMWIPFASYYFAVAFTDNLRRRAWSLAAALAVSAYFTVRLLADTPWMLASLHRYYFGWFSAYGPGMKYFILSFSALMLACNLELFSYYRRLTSGIERKQTIWVLVGFSIGSFGACDYLPGYGIEVFPFGFLFILAFVASFAYAIEVYRLLDVRTAFIQTGSYLLASSILAAPLIVLVQVLHPALIRMSGFELGLIFLGLFGAGLAYWKWAEKRLLKVFQRRQESLIRALEEMDGNLRFSSGLRETTETIAERLVALLGLYHASYWHSQAGGGSARLLETRNLQLSPSLSAPGALIRRLASVEEVQEMRDLPQDPETQSFLSSAQAALVLPVRKGEDLLGFFVLGPKKSLQAFKGYELDLLNEFRPRLGVSLTNAMMTEQVHEMASQVMLAEQRAREVKKIKDDFLHAVSHELRTPLFALSGYAEALLDKQTPGRGSKFAHTIHRAALRIANLVADMIRSASLERETTEVRAAWFDFGAASERVLEPFRSKIGLVRFSLELPERPYSVYADREKIEDVLFRLVSNAVKYSPAEGTVTVWGRRDGADFEFGVADQGPGLSFEARRHVFEKFNRPYGGTDEVNLKNPGSGLGLHIARTLIEMHRGTILVDSAARGCRVVVRLPQPAVPSGEAAGAAPPLGGP